MLILTQTGTGTYTFYAEDLTCSNSVRTPITVTVSPIITVNSGSICLGQSFTITPSGASTYTYSGGSAVVNPTATTNYSVVGTTTAGCVSTSPVISTVIVNACTGINQISTINQFKIYPNPNNGVLVIEIIEPAKVTIYNTLGSVLETRNLTDTKTEINLSEHPSGIYFIKIGSVTKKIIKE